MESMFITKNISKKSFDDIMDKICFNCWEGNNDNCSHCYYSRKLADNTIIIRREVCVNNTAIVLTRDKGYAFLQDGKVVFYFNNPWYDSGRVKYVSDKEVDVYPAFKKLFKNLPNNIIRFFCSQIERRQNRLLPDEIQTIISVGDGALTGSSLEGKRDKDKRYLAIVVRPTWNDVSSDWCAIDTEESIPDCTRFVGIDFCRMIKRNNRFTYVSYIPVK